MLKLYKIWYNSGNWNGVEERCYIANSEEEVKSNSEFYNARKHSYGDLDVFEISFEDYFDDPAPIENMYEYNVSVNITKNN